MRRSTHRVHIARASRHAFFGLLAAVSLAACGPGRAPIVDVAPLADTPDTQGPYEIVAVITDDGSIAAAEVRWFVAGDAAPRPAALVRDEGSDRWVAKVPGQPAGATVRWLVEVEDDEGHVVTAPAAASDGSQPTFSFRITEPAGD